MEDRAGDMEENGRRYIPSRELQVAESGNDGHLAPTLSPPLHSHPRLNSARLPTRHRIWHPRSSRLLTSLLQTTTPSVHTPSSCHTLASRNTNNYASRTTLNPSQYLPRSVHSDGAGWGRAHRSAYSSSSTVFAKLSPSSSSFRVPRPKSIKRKLGVSIERNSCGFHNGPACTRMFRMCGEP